MLPCIQWQRFACARSVITRRQQNEQRQKPAISLENCGFFCFSRVALGKNSGATAKLELDRQIYPLIGKTYSKTYSNLVVWPLLRCQSNPLQGRLLQDNPALYLPTAKVILLLIRHGSHPKLVLARQSSPRRAPQPAPQRCQKDDCLNGDLHFPPLPVCPLSAPDVPGRLRCAHLKRRNMSCPTYPAP